MPPRRRDVKIQVELNYLQEEEDVNNMIKGVEASNAILPPAGIEIFPGPLIHLPWFRNHIARATCLPYFHYCGTCPMQTANDDGHWVVDEDFRVRGLQSLRICDASVFPTTISAPTALTCAALGHSFGSKLVKAKKL
jgi:choline dehydrogenase